MSKATRRRIDAANPLERLTTEQRQQLYQRNLSNQVKAACDKFLRSRGLPVRAPFLDRIQPATAATPPAPPQARESPCPPDPSPCQKSTAFHSNTESGDSCTPKTIQNEIPK